MAGRLLLAVLLTSFSVFLSACSETDRAKPDAGPAENAATSKPAPKPKKPALPRSITLDLGEKITMRLALIPAGEFMMGSKTSPAEVARKFARYGGREEYYTSEHPRHRVTISRPFYMGVFEVTKDQWTSVMGPGPWDGKNCDKARTGDVANHISWIDAEKFCKALSKTTGRQITLPTEAQWEYACRAGRDTAFSFGDDESKLGVYAWYAANTLGRGEPYPHRAGEKIPNAWGLYDMHGNAAEWCRDWYAESYADGAKVDPENTTPSKERVLRGGQWGLYPDACRSAYRFKHTPDNRGCSCGFRIVTTAPPDVPVSLK